MIFQECGGSLRACAERVLGQAFLLNLISDIKLSKKSKRFLKLATFSYMNSHRPVAATIVKILKDNDYWFEVFEHAPARTSKEAAAIRPEYTLQQGAKALIIRVKPAPPDKKFVMLVMSASDRFDADKVKRLLNIKEIRFATEEEVMEITSGVLPGGVPPFGGLFSLPVYADEGLFDNKEIIFNAGDRSVSVAMKSEDYRKAANPVVAGIV